ncbi:hemerythrin domain-containing protein [Streptomyces chartreusis]|uniref:hypothetical protein n=1 Tax=Streptomyces chartreusis TaxID=1969 RepID=UPI003669A862
MPKIDLYRNVHMGQRARLFALATELGAADVCHSGAAAEQAARCLAMTRELREHADHEDTFIHQLLRERALRRRTRWRPSTSASTRPSSRWTSGHAPSPAPRPRTCRRPSTLCTWR